MRRGEDGQSARRKIPYTAILIIGISIVVLVVIVIGIVATCRSPSRYVELNATVTLTSDGTQFLVSNKDNFDWTNVKMEINGGVVIPGFSCTVPKIASEKTYTVAGKRFFEPDGSQFDQNTTEIQRFSITCDTPQGPGSWSRPWP